MLPYQIRNSSKEEKFIPRFYEPEKSNQLQISSFNINPFQEFRIWFDDAVQNEKGIEPNAMALATATKTGLPSVRYVLLKHFDASTFVFFTNYESRKCREILENPKAALLFYWPSLQKQIRIEGTLERTSKETNQEYFQSRDLESKVTSFYSKQSRVMSEQQRTQFFENIKHHLDEKKEIESPEFWGGFQLKPESFEFMKLQKSRKHDRVVYSGVDGHNWKMSWLFP